MKFIKSIITTLLVLVISAGVFFYIVKDKQVKDNILKTTLELFGDDLLAMYPEGEQKQMLAQKFNEFLQRAEQEQVAPQEIERVAAGILNITTADSLPPAESVIGLLDPVVEPDTVLSAPAAPPVPPRGERISRDIWRDPWKRRPPDDYRYKYKWDETKKEDLAQRLKDVKDLQYEIKTLWESDSTLHPLHKQVVFNADSGLKVELNLQLEKLFDENSELKKQLAELEKEKILVWNEDMDPALAGLKAARMIVKNLPVNPPDLETVIHVKGLTDSLGGHGTFNFKLDSLDVYIEKTVKEIERLETEKAKKIEKNKK